MITAYKIIGHNRDIIDGKGEYELSYMLIEVWYNFFPALATYALSKFVNFEGHPYGSWKDIKYFCNYCKSIGLGPQHPLLQYAYSLMNEQIALDISSDNKSLAGKWAPREKSVKFGWIFNELAFSYFRQYLESVKIPGEFQDKRARLKCKTHYRKLIAQLNKSLDTVQIKQCGNNWADIDHTKTTSITHSKQKKAFLNVTKNNETRSEKEDRQICATKYTELIKKAAAGECEIKGRHVGMADFVKQAISLMTVPNQLEADLINSQWRDSSSYTGSLENFIGLVDTSGSMFEDGKQAGYVAIALGIRCAEKSSIGKRVMCFNDTASWNNLEGYNNFVDMVHFLKSDILWGGSTNFYAAMDRILDAIIESKLSKDKVTNMVLAIFSDMQIDASSTSGICDTGALYEVMTKKYAEVGMRLYGEPILPPHILFWNMTSGNGFPVMSTQKNVSMLSGYSPALLNQFCDKGMEAFSDITPWNGLIDALSNPRYKCLEDYIKQTF